MSRLGSYPVLACCLLAGCGLTRPHLDKALMADRGKADRNENVAACYLVRHPDVLEVAVTGRPDLTGLKPISTDGQILLDGQRLRVEGQNTHEVARRVALATGVNPVSVRVRVVEFHSQYVYLLGPGVGVQRAVSYQGPETVLDLLQRAGGVSPGAEPNNAYVVRPRIAQDQPPEIFRINLHGILMNKDQQTNVRLQPFDQVFIGETRRASFQKCVPPCLRPIYESVCGLARPGSLVSGEWFHVHRSQQTMHTTPRSALTTHTP